MHAYARCFMCCATSRCHALARLEDCRFWRWGHSYLFLSGTKLGPIVQQEDLYDVALQSAPQVAVVGRLGLQGCAAYWFVVGVWILILALLYVSF